MKDMDDDADEYGDFLLFGLNLWMVGPEIYK